MNKHRKGDTANCKDLFKRFVFAFPRLILQKVHLCWQPCACGFPSSRFNCFQDVYSKNFPQNTNSLLIFSNLLVLAKLSGESLSLCVSTSRMKVCKITS